MKKEVSFGVRIKGNAKGGVQAVSMTGAELKKLRSEMNKTRASGKKLNTSTKSWAASTLKFKGALGLLGAALSAREVLSMADDFNVLNQRIKTATDATGDYASVSRELFDISQKNGVALASTVDLYQRLSFSAEALGASSADILLLSDAVQQLGAIGGTTKEQMDNALLQFSQMLGQAKPQAEELNSILDAMPLLAKRIEKGLNLLPGSLKTAVKEGRVLTQDIFDTLLDQAPEIAAKFEKIPNTLTRSGRQLSDSLGQAVSQLDRAVGLTEGLADSFSAWAKVINFFTQGRSEEDERILKVRELQAEYSKLGLMIERRQGFDNKTAAVLERRRNVVLAEYNALMGKYIDNQAQQVDLFEVNVTASRKTGSVSGLPPPKRSTKQQESRKNDPFAASQARAAVIKAQFDQLDIGFQRYTDRLNEISALDDYLAGPMDRLEDQHLNRFSILVQAREDDLISEERYQQLKTDLQEKYERERDQMTAAQRSVMLSNASELFDGLAGLSAAFGGEQSDTYRAMFAVSKAFAIADSIVKIQAGIASAASLTFPANLAAMAAVASQTAGIVSTIQGVSFAGAAHGGLTSVPEEATYLLNKRERVLSPNQNKDFTDFINNGGSAGGLTVNINEDASKAGQVERNGNELTVFVAAATNAVFSEFDAGSSRARRVEKRYGLTRRAG